MPVVLYIGKITRKLKEEELQKFEDLNILDPILLGRENCKGTKITLCKEELQKLHGLKIVDPILLRRENYKETNITFCKEKVQKFKV